MGAGEKAQQSRALATLAVDPGSFSCINMVAYSSRMSGTQAVHIYTCKQNTHTYNKNNSSKRRNTALSLVSVLSNYVQ